jgi:hypothetical protein
VILGVRVCHPRRRWMRAFLRSEAYRLYRYLPSLGARAVGDHLKPHEKVHCITRKCCKLRWRPGCDYGPRWMHYN